jgi:hypothetical protein
MKTNKKNLLLKKTRRRMRLPNPKLLPLLKLYTRNNKPKKLAIKKIEDLKK